MPGFFKRLYSPLLFDGLFAASGTFAVIGIMLNTSRAYPPIAPAAQPPIKGAAIIGAIFVAGLLAIFSTRHDQKHADDFLFRTLTKSAFIAMFTVFFTLALWQMLFTASLGGVSMHATIGVLIASWSLAYFYTRIRGTGL
ncbi:hypothetical protein EWE75_12405 [Sphingomonas populi]|uniref:Uncharacterized protein n=1 Tax=Sphingomonas populi TaxID=2484750 RepID=A0A4Q6Y1R7_9SPHN|nr:hypothetical protein [Sphingomonas populi]RZF64142.1 hypothetical protein EWE75_12405 [Sphingomonas populi]